jgi:hypothetical protein
MSYEIFCIKINEARKYKDTEKDQKYPSLYKTLFIILAG